MTKLKIATLGAATLDVFLTGKDLHAKRDVRTSDYVEQFPLGAKLELDQVVFSTGGGATNAAVTFARQGFEATLLGKIGDDLPGREIIQALNNEGVKTGQVAIDLDGASGYSTILVARGGERTVLVYRGASEQLAAKDFKLNSLDADWLYVSSLAGNLELMEDIIKHPYARKLKIAFNPGSRELAQPGRLKKLFDHINVLLLNREELESLYGKAPPRELLQAASTCCEHVVMTDGSDGSWVSDGNKMYRAGIYASSRVVDRTGAGDAFGSGFVASLARGQDIEQALTMASANSTAVVGQIGAKAGILPAGAKLKSMKIQVSALK